MIVLTAYGTIGDGVRTIKEGAFDYITKGDEDNKIIPVIQRAFAKDLLESEMFGYVAGAFTGATKNKKGLFEEAHRGTLFLDEIGELDPSPQSKFLKVLESNNFIKAGDTKPTQVDVRIIAASNRNLEVEIERGNFRADLYYRISVMKIEIPPLRERKEDIKQLTEYFIEYYSKKLGKNIKKISNDLFQKLEPYNFPGNIRELRNIIERAVILSDGQTLNESALPKEILHKANLSSQSLNLEDVEKTHILSTLEQTRRLFKNITRFAS